MTVHRVEITLPDETWDRLESARGHEARASFVKRPLESALRVGSTLVGESSAAPSRASVDPSWQELPALPPGLAASVGVVRKRAKSRQELLNEAKFKRGKG